MIESCGICYDDGPGNPIRIFQLCDVPASCPVVWSKAQGPIISCARGEALFVKASPAVPFDTPYHEWFRIDRER